MSAEEGPGGRHRAIVERLAVAGEMRVVDLARELGVATVTLRIDVRELARRGLVTRRHGRVGPLPTDPAQAHPTGSDHRSVDPSPVVTPAAVSPTGRSVVAPGRPDGPVTIGMLVPQIDYYFTGMVSAARLEAGRRGARLLLAISGNDAGAERDCVSQLIADGAEGLVLTTALDPQTSPATRSWIAGLPVPVVLAERRIGLSQDPVEFVASDHEQGAYDCVTRLAGIGCRAIGLVSLATLTAPRLIDGFRAGVADLGRRPALVRQLSDESPEVLDEAATAIVRAVRRGALDGVILHHDLVALAVVSRLRRAGITIPEEVSVISYDDEVAELCHPALSAMSPPRAEVGATAVALVLARLLEPNPPQHRLLLRPRYASRNSCRSHG